MRDNFNELSSIWRFKCLSPKTHFKMISLRYAPVKHFTFHLWRRLFSGRWFDLKSLGCRFDFKVIHFEVGAVSPNRIIYCPPTYWKTGSTLYLSLAGKISQLPSEGKRPKPINGISNDIKKLPFTFLTSYRYDRNYFET